MDTVALPFVRDKYCLIIDYLGSKESSHKLQASCVISFYFCLYLIFYAYAQRFDVTGNLEKILGFENFWVLRKN